ncbi:Hypothetical predicted protein [Mytilus galloprovincialis]|uniref:Uncharacterized protein n=1 Tax=Mytilus galloprovincialis TaxID=29158 RepID=A0A8B6BP27_MYTGA|nr:Hypothetical predicted protein [Mytilus galloprovincialis]
MVLKCMPGIGDAIGNRIMDIRNKEIHIDRLSTDLKQVNNSQRQDISPVTSDDMPNEHVLHFPPSVQHDIQYRHQDQQEGSHLQQASTAYHRLFNSDSPVKQHRDIYKPETPSVERVQPFQPPIQQDNYHRQLQFNEYETVIPSTKKYQKSTNNIQSGVNRVQQPMLPVKKGVQLQQQVQGLHQRLAQLQLGVNSYAQPTHQQNPATAPVSLPQQRCINNNPLTNNQGINHQIVYQGPNHLQRLGTQLPCFNLLGLDHHQKDQHSPLTNKICLV